MEKSEFSKFLFNIFSNGAVMHSLALGFDMGLFEYLCNVGKPVSLDEVSEAMNMKPRYVKEWLSSMVSAGIMHQDPITYLYTVPDGHKDALLTTVAMAPMATFMGTRAERVKECFKKDGPWGVGFDQNPEMFEWMDKFRKATADKSVAEEIMPLWSKHPGLIQKLEDGIKVLDIACGTGNHIIAIAEKFPKSHFFGLDYSNKAISLANELKKLRGVKNVTFVEGDAHHLPEEWALEFDVAFMNDALHDLPDPNSCLREIYRVLKYDGFYNLIEISSHSDPLQNAGDIKAAMMYSIGMFTCMTASMAAPPHVGYGPMWGVEEIEKTLKKNKFQIVGEIVHIQGKACFNCTKIQ